MLDIIPSGILVTTAVIFTAFIFIGFILARLYQRSSKEISFVRTGFGGESNFRGRCNCPTCIA